MTETPIKRLIHPSAIPTRSGTGTRKLKQAGEAWLLLETDTRIKGVWPPMDLQGYSINDYHLGK